MGLVSSAAIFAWHRHSRVRGGTLFYFTNNSYVYYIINGGSSKNVELHWLAQAIKILLIELGGCWLQMVLVLGNLMIDEWTYMLSQETCLAPACLTWSSIMEPSLALYGVSFLLASFGGTGLGNCRFGPHDKIHLPHHWGNLGFWGNLWVVFHLGAGTRGGLTSASIVFRHMGKRGGYYDEWTVSSTLGPAERLTIYLQACHHH